MSSQERSSVAAADASVPHAEAPEPADFIAIGRVSSEAFKESLQAALKVTRDRYSREEAARVVGAKEMSVQSPSDIG
jgi:hypothetical protein